jgi:hypothetical protein
VPWLAASAPPVPVRAAELKPFADDLGKLVRDFGLKLPHVFMALKDEATFAQAQLVHERIADVAIDLYVSACVLARLDHLAAAGGKPADPFADPVAGRYFLALAFRRVRQNLAALDANDDAELLAAAASTLGRV